MPPKLGWSSQCLVVCQLCIAAPSFKTWSSVKMLGHLKSVHLIDDVEDAQRLVDDWWLDASRGRPRYPAELCRRILENGSIEDLAVTLGFILTSAGGECCGIVNRTYCNSISEFRTPAPKKRKLDQSDSSCVVDTTEEIPNINPFVCDEGTLDYEEVKPDIDSETNWPDSPTDSQSTGWPTNTHQETGGSSAQERGVQAAVSLPLIVVESVTSNRKKRGDLPPGWDLRRNEAARNAFAPGLALKTQPTKFGEYSRVVWRLCTQCGVPCYVPVVRRFCCTRDVPGHWPVRVCRSGWRVIPSSLWNWISSHFEGELAVLAELTSILREYGVVEVARDNEIIRVGSSYEALEECLSGRLQEKQSMRSSVTAQSSSIIGSRGFEDLFPPCLEVIEKRKNAWVFCPACVTIKEPINHMKNCRKLERFNFKTRLGIVSLIQEKRLVIVARRLEKIMRMTNKRLDLRSGIAGAMQCVGAVVLAEELVSPSQFVLKNL